MLSPLQSEDLVTLLALVAANDDRDLARRQLAISEEAMTHSLRRCADAELYAARGQRVRRHDLAEFLIYGARHVFPGVYEEEPALGVPTSYSAPPLRRSFVVGSRAEIVWRSELGTIVGTALVPLSEAVPSVGRVWPAFHELAALTDALRAGRSRERAAAAERMREALAA